MKRYPPIPRIEDATDGLLESGHLWLTEKIDGDLLRVQLRENGLLRFGDRERVYENADSVPEPYGHAVRHVRERLDREALRGAVDDVESIVLFGVATHRRRIEYDWDRLPSFLGVDVYSAEQGSFRPPDAAERIFDRLGLEPVNAVERERNTRDFNSSTYAIPESAWYDGPAEGVVVRNKKGGRAKLIHPAFDETQSPEPIDVTAKELADSYASDRRFEKIATELRFRDEPISFESLYDRTVEDILREKHGRLFHSGSSVDVSEFRSAVAARTQRFVNGLDG